MERLSRAVNRSPTHQSISSDANVWLNMNSRTNVVSVYVEGHDPNLQSAKLTVIYRYPRLRKISGDSPKQLGAISSRLLEPFVVRLTDGGSRGNGNNVPGQVVTFTSGAGGGTFSAHPDFPADAATGGTIPAGRPQTVIDTTASVTTDSQGYARVYLVLGSSAGEHAVTAQIGTVTNTQVTFTATAVTEATASTITKVAETDGQRANDYGRIEKPLTVIVSDQSGNPISGVQVTFNDRSGGTLSSISTDPGDLVDDLVITGNSTNPRTRVVNTSASGKASIRYTPRDGTGAQTVGASISVGGLSRGPLWGQRTGRCWQRWQR